MTTDRNVDTAPGEVENSNAWGDRAYLNILIFVIKSVPPTIGCIALNLSGFLATQFLGSSVLFLDMAGTAFASFTRGIGYGVVVALASNFAAQWIPASWFPGSYNPEIYKWFALANAAGALSWCILPRLRVIAPRLFRRLPSRDVFSSNPDFGYRRLLFHVCFIGFVTGVVVAIAGFGVQELILGCQAQAQICSQASVTASTAATLNQAINSYVGDESLSRFLTLLPLNIFDKTLATAIAIALALSLSHLPNHLRQSQHLKEAYPRYIKSPIRVTAIVLYVLLWSWFFYLYISAIPASSHRSTAMITSIIIFSILLIPLIVGQKLPLYNVFYRDECADPRLFHEVRILRGQSFQRDVLEDVFKMVTVLIALADVLLTEGTSDKLFRLARTVIFLQLLRYVLVFVMRLSGRFDQKPHSLYSDTHVEGVKKPPPAAS